MTQSRILIIVGVALLAAVAIFGLVRKTDVASQPFLNPASAPITPATYAGDSAELPWYATRPAVRTIEEPPPRPVVQTYAEPPSRHHREIVRRRKTKNSVAIVAGSAGVGAAIGAIAGGGKGAGIGALAGGAGGFVYDRLTHKRRVEY